MIQIRSGRGPVSGRRRKQATTRRRNRRLCLETREFPVQVIRMMIVCLRLKAGEFQLEIVRVMVVIVGVRRDKEVRLVFIRARIGCRLHRLC